MSDPHQNFANRFLGRADGAAVAGGALLQTDSNTFSGVTSTTVIVPTYATFPLSAALTTTLASSLLHIYAYVAWNHDAGTGLNRTANFRFRLNGALIAASRATSSLTVSGGIMTVTYSRLLVIVAGLQTVTFEWAKQSGSGTLACDPGASPDVFGANLKIQEYAA